MTGIRDCHDYTGSWLNNLTFNVTNNMTVFYSTVPADGRYKSPRSGKYPASHSKNLSRNNNGSSEHISKNSGSSRPSRSVGNQPRVAFDIPEFLQEKQVDKNKGQSPVVQRRLGDPDPVILQQGSTSPKRGLLIPQSELEVPDFLCNSHPNGRVSFSSNDSDVKAIKVSQNRPSGIHRSKPVVTRTPGNLRTTYATKGLNTSQEQMNIESDSKRHENAAQGSSSNATWRTSSPPKARGTFVIGNDSLTSQSMQSLHSRSTTKLNESNHRHDVKPDIAPDLVDDFGTFTLQRKYKKRQVNKTNLSPEEKFAPGVTGKYAVKQHVATTKLSPKENFAPGINGKYAVKQEIAKSKLSPEERLAPGVTRNTEFTIKPQFAARNRRNGEESNREVQLENGNQWSLTDTDSMQSASSLSFTDFTSPSSSAHRNFPLNQMENHLQPENATRVNGSIHQHQGYESPDSALGYYADSSFANQDSSIDEGKKISRKNSLQAHLRHRVQEYERMKQENPRQNLHVRYDSDSTTISDQSLFGEGMSSVTRFSASSIGHINNIQDYLLLKIFSYLSSLELCKVSGVCRRWQSLAWDPILWNIIEITHYEESDINRILRNLLATLAMSTQGYCLMVHCVKLNGSELVSDKGLGYIARYCIDLEELEISGCCCVTSKGLQDVLLNCHNLYHLNLSGCTCVNSICVPNTNGYSMGDHGSFLKLRHLDLSDCVAFDDFGLRTIGLSCGLLESLYLRRCSRITDVGMKHVASHCHHLKELSTSDCFKIRDFSLKEIARNIPGLKYLSVAKCSVSDTGIKYLGRHCVRLKYLNVRGCEAITDVGIAFVVQNCLKLRSLDIGKCDITDSVMNTIGIHCPQLKKLSIRGCDKVSDNGIKSIAAQCCHLQYFNVQECNVSFESFTFIRQHCRNCIIEHTCPAFF